MFEFLLQLFQNAGNQVNVFNQQDIDGAIQALSAWMNGGQNPTIRLFVDAGGGRGNQAGGVNMLRRITEPVNVGGLAYVGPNKSVDIIYNQDDPETVVKLRQLLQFAVDQDAGAWPVGALQAQQVQLQLIAMNAAHNLPQVNLGFSGVSDFDQGMPALLNSSFYLRFQPFLYHKPVQLQFLDGTATVDLATVPELGGASYSERGFRIVIPNQINWATYTQSPDPVLARRASVLEDIITNIYAGNIQQYELLLTYSIHTNFDAAGNPTPNAIGAEPYGQVVQLVLGCLATQQGARALPNPRPVVIVNVDHFYNNQPGPPPNGDPFEPVEFLLGGGPTALEMQLLANANPRNYTAAQRQAKQIWERRNAYVRGANAAQRTTFLNDPTLVQTQQALGQLIGHADRVLWVQLGPPLPNELFNYVFSQSTFPSVFEGVNTANVALNFGTPYFHVNRPQNNTILYPTRVLANRPGDSVLRRLQTAADQVGAPLANWPNNADARNYPPELIAAWIREFRTEAAQGPLHQYFTNLRNFYQDTANDKLSLALTYLEQRRAAAQVQPNLALAKQSAGCSDVAAAVDILDSLYASLQANLHDGVLALVPGALTKGKIQQFLAGMIVKAYGKPFVLADATIVPVPADGEDITQITVTGTTDVFGPSAATKVVFTAPSDVLNAALDFGFDVEGSFTGMDWIVFRDPSLGLALSDGVKLSFGSAAGTVLVGGQELSIAWRFPTPDDAMLVTARFVGSYPSIASFFALAGGINLVQILPPPFNALVDLGLAELEIAYDVEASIPQALSFLIKSNSSEPIPLFGQVALQDLAVQVSVESPASLTARRISMTLDGDFALGEKTPDSDPAIIHISATSPNYVFGGELVAGTITFAELATFFLSEVPELPATPTITEFSFSYNQPNASWAVSVNLNIGWKISVAGAEVLDIENLQMSIVGQGDLVTSRLAGTLSLFPDSEDALGILLAASQQANGWLFEGKQLSGQVPLGKLLGYLGLETEQPYGIDGLAVSIDTSSNAWMFQGKTAQPWQVPFIPELSVAASLRMGATSSELPSRLGDPRTNNNFFARLETKWIWQSIEIDLWFDYNLQTPSFGFTWGVLETVVAQDPTSKDWIGTIKFTDSVTLGSIVETMVEWVTGSRFSLEAPWSLLNGISLGKLSLTYNFTKKTVSFNVAVGPINLGFAQIDGIEITYESGNPNPDDNGVMVTLTGSFPWNTGDSATVGDTGALGPWDTSKPGTAPAPPGNGNKYFDLRLLALGQHVTMPCFATADTVQKAIACMATLPEPVPGEPPPVTFDAKSSWLIGTDFGILRLEKSESNAAADAGYMLTLQVVFNDPRLYALRIALAGEPAKIFKGLDFQILYRQISEAVGVYQAQITLPDVMRRLSVGAYTIVLPVFGIDVYTNGDFQVDIGFPWNQDFSRSFTIEAIIAPGIPLLGSAGFYFGKLSSATSNRVPTVSNGTFNPVIVFGFGLQVGFGKSLELGILKAGFSLTAFGILEGVIAKWNPYALEGASTSGADQLQGSYYFMLQGSVGIIGKLYGTIDFAIIKADVNVDIKLMLQLTYESYVSIAMSVLASVDVSVSVKINLGLFKIRIHLSFSARLKETFVIENHGKAPWEIVKPQGEGVLAAPIEARLGILRPRAVAARPLPIPNWSNLTAPASKTELAGYVAIAPTVAMDEWQPGVLAAQQACGVIMLFIDSVPPADQDAGVSASKAAGEQPDSSFEALAKLVLVWAVAAVWGSPISAETLLGKAVDGTLLDYLADEVLVSSDAEPTPIGQAALASFLADQVVMTVTLPPNEDASADVTVFPIPAELELELPKHGDYPGYAYQFASYNALDQATLTELREYFDQLAVQVEAEQDREQPRLLESSTPLSMAAWIESDYFLLLARQMVQAARDALRDFKYPLSDAQSSNDIVVWIQGKGASEYRLVDLFTANPTHPLSAGKPVRISGVRYAVQAGVSFTSIASEQYAGLVSATSLASLPANADNSMLLAAGAQLHFSAGGSYEVQPHDSLQSIADAHFGGSLSELLAGSDALVSTTLLQPLAIMLIPELTHQSESGDTLRGLASRYGVGIDLLATSSNGDIVGLFDASEPYLDVPHLPRLELSELIAEAQRTLAIVHLSGMASRYSLHGMRLPTTGITPEKLGMWVVQQPDGTLRLPAQAGLFALTGQQFPLPSLDVSVGDFEIAVSRSQGPSWLVFECASGVATDSLSFSLVPGSIDAQRLLFPADYARKARLSTGVQLAAGETFRSTLLAYALGEKTPWQSPTSVRLPYGDAPEGVFDSQFLRLPETVRGLADPQTRAINPRFVPQLAIYDEASGETRTSAIGYYGWASLITFTIKRVPPVVDSPASLTTYEITGAGAQSAELLAELLAQHGGDDGFIDQLLIAFAPDSAGSAPDGLQTDAPADLTFGIAQVNLSTVTRPPTLARASNLASDQQGGARLLNGKMEFVRLLWEAAITRSGGFFLYYYDAGTKAGLPDRIFNDKNEATVTLVVVYSKPAAIDQQDCIGSFMNALAIGANLEANATPLVEAAPPTGLAYTTTAADTLAGIAYRYFSDVGDLVAANPVSLRAAAPLALREGVYEVPPTGSVGPGGDLDAIASHFGTTRQAIVDANPNQQAWPSPLPPGTALRLPSIDTTVAANLGGDTLQSIASYYGIPLTALAAHNQDVIGLYPSGTDLQVPGGPRRRTSTVAPGVVPFAATRVVPPEVPADPQAPDYAVDFLLNTFNMLGFSIAANADFDESNIGLPAGPVSSPADPQSMDKIRAARVLAAGDTWSYQLAVPYSKLAKRAPASVAGLPDADQSPYLGVGGIIQPQYQWQDLYGNTLVTTLTLPQLADAVPVNLPAVSLGYTDALISPRQWPAVGLDWTLAGDSTAPTLEIEFSFSTDTYSPASNSSWQQNAARDLRVYTQLYYQLQDPNGVAWSLESSLFVNEQPAIGPAQVAALEQWLFTGTATESSIFAYLSDRAAGKTEVPAPPALHVLAFDLREHAINDAAIFALELALTITRTGGAVQSDFETTAGIRSVSAPIAPASSGSKGEAMSLTAFADAFTQALSKPGEYRLEVAVGVDRERSGGSQGNAVWVVRVGVGPGQALQFEVDQPGAPQLFAPRPISNVLISRAGVPIYDYSTGQGLSPTPTRTLDFGGVDLDLWGQQLFAAVDGVLSPQFTAAIQLVDAHEQSEHLQLLLGQKSALAGIASQWMLPVFDSDSGADASVVREAFRQQMLVRLSNAYSTRAAIQFATTMDGVNMPAPAIAPRLFGNVDIVESSVPDGLLSLTSTKLSLESGSQALASLLSGPEVIRGAQGEVVPNVALTLGYANAAIEHQVAPIPGIEGYLASTWLNFVRPVVDLDAELGSFAVPLILRSFPTNPSATTQSGAAAKPDSDVLGDMLLWDYGFEYSLPFHFPQDRVECAVEFNLHEQVTTLAALEDAFAQLAQFIEVFPEVARDLDGILAGIDATTTDPKLFRDASVAVASLTTMLGWIITPPTGAAALSVRQPAPTLTGAAELGYEFAIAEGEVSIAEVDALLITIINAGPLPPGLAVAQVFVAPDEYELQRYVPTDGRPGDAFYWYKSRTTGLPLSAAEGQAIASRLVRLDGLNLMQRQDARATMAILRNQGLVSGQTTAPEFVYRSPNVSYPNPLLPSFQRSTQVDIAALGPNGRPVSRTLQQQLALLFSVLLANNVEPTLTFQVAVEYGYRINAGLAPVPVPMFLQPPTSVTLDPGSGLPDTMIATWTSAIKDWFATTAPRPVDPGQAPGELGFELTIMSNFTRRPMPLLRLTRLTLSLGDITDLHVGM